MADLSRRCVLKGLGVAVVGADAATRAIAEVGPMVPTLEQRFGPARLAHLEQQFHGGRPLPYGDIWRDGLLDEAGSFRASAKFRDVLTELLVSETPFQVTACAEDAAWHKYDTNVMLVFWKYRVLPAGSRSAFYQMNGRRPHFLWRVWRGEGWKTAGWSMPPLERIRGKTAWYWPRPETV